MGGFPSTLRARLLLWVLGTLAAGTVAVGALSYRLARDELDAVFDANLREVALAVATHQAFDVTRVPPLPGMRGGMSEHGPLAFVTIAWTRDGVRVFSSDPGALVPFVGRPGPARVTAGGEAWQTYTVITDEGVVQAAQRIAVRQRLAAASASKVVLPMLGLIACVGLLIAVALRRGLAPLGGAVRDVERRSADALEPLAPQALPAELHPLIGAINGLMARLGDALGRQKRFVADAAHELRTPLTALRLQVQLLERARDEAARRAATAELHAGVDRASRLVEQLLELSRLDPEVRAAPQGVVDLAELAASMVTRFAARAHSAGIDLRAALGEKGTGSAAGPAVGAAIGAAARAPAGAGGTPGTAARAPRAAPVRGDRAQLESLLSNLVDNALRYTPRGGRVDMRVAAAGDGFELAVLDDGPGIPPEERERVFDRFHRGSTAAAAEGPDDAALPPGSGLGLAIVRAIADRHRAEVTLGAGLDGRGLGVRVRFPALSQP